MIATVETTGYIAGSNGIRIFYRHYRAATERARMVVSHGLGEHSGRYGNVIERVVPNGISVWAPDHRGHGHSGGRRGHVMHFAEYSSDLRKTVELARKGLAPEMPCFLLGHSLGGLIALDFARRYPGLSDGLIVSSPCLGMVIDVPSIKKLVGSLMSYVWPRLSLGNELDATKISRDPAVVSAYANDPLVHNRVSARFFTELLGAIGSVNAQAATLDLPVLMQVAGEDYLVNAASAEQFFQQLSVADKTLHVYEGMYHEVYNAPQAAKERVLNDLAKWLEKRMSNDN